LFLDCSAIRRSNQILCRNNRCKSVVIFIL